MVHWIPAHLLSRYCSPLVQSNSSKLNSKRDFESKGKTNLLSVTYLKKYHRILIYLLSYHNIKFSWYIKFFRNQKCLLPPCNLPNAIIKIFFVLLNSITNNILFIYWIQIIRELKTGPILIVTIRIVLNYHTTITFSVYLVQFNSSLLKANANCNCQFRGKA